MERDVTNRRWRLARRLFKDKSGQSLVEIAVMVPLFTLLMAFAVDFGYFFVAAADITSSARNAVQYSILGYEGPAQSAEPVAGPVSTTASVAALAMADLTSLTGSSTTTTVRVCTKANGVSSNLAVCTSYGPTGTVYTPAADPEAPRFVLQRVDVTYTVQPPIPLSIFGQTLLPNLNFHRGVSMRSMD
jgi:Flp pilus assembly protein TadG